MRILLSADPMIPVPPKLYGGIERVISLLIQELHRRGHDLALLAHPESSEPGCQRYAWPDVEMRGRFDWRFPRQLHRVVKSFRPELVHSFSRLIWLLPLLTEARLPLLMSYQREISLRNVSLAARLAGARLSFSACSSKLMSGVPDQRRWHAIPNMVDGSRYDPQYRVAADAPLVFLSRLDRIKGAHLAIAAAKAAGETLILAGNRADSGPERDYFEREIAPALDDRQIRWIGPVDDQQKNTLLGRAKAMIVPIQWEEPFGIVFAEALACATPVIASPRGALPEIIDSGVQGFLVEGEAALVDAIRALPTIDRHACRQRFEDRFALATVVDQYEHLYRQLIEASKHV
ncbi:glycosyltransferase family 4 protein [Ahniella affigens]|uniref:Glycosyltransferase family 4 protein n=1 Tax=Ahniella affigens TaxID=2021234 RepID=A0A2P1PYE7_9GAMM|nr:glycosyltransferase [Ahniella affigens]AVP99877.1 glycosyltransferase family 4 protein [Ahniella affigens]